MVYNIYLEDVYVRIIKKKEGRIGGLKIVVS